MTFEILLSIPKSFYVSYKLLSLKEAIKLPILVRYNTRLLNLSGRLSTKEEISRKMIIFGFGDVPTIDTKYERSVLNIEGDIEISGNCHFGQGSRLDIRKEGVLSIGADFSNTANISIVCTNRIEIGKNFLSSWQTFIMDTDFHPCSPRGESVPIKIGENVWMGMKSTILKGSQVPTNCVIAACSLVNKRFTKEDTILAGIPAIEKIRTKE